MTDKSASDSPASNRDESITGRFAFTPVPSESEALQDASADEQPLLSSNDVFGLVLQVGAVQPIWQLKSLFCYRGIWRDEKLDPLTGQPSNLRREVILTIATDPTTVSKLRQEWKILLYLHTGIPMDGITHPLLWKTSPDKTQIALISKYHPGERNLKQAYLDSAVKSTYVPPPVSEFCVLAIKIMQVLEQIHEKRVRHGNLRPEIISFWFEYSEINVCIRDFTESALLGESETPVSDDPSLQQVGDPSIPISHCVHYLAPEALGGAKQLCSSPLYELVDC